MGRNDWILVAAFVLLPFSVGLVSGHEAPGWITAAAAVAQVIAVFAAVTLSSAENRKQADYIRQTAYEDFVRSTNTIVNRALVTANWVRKGIVDGVADGAHQRNPTRMLEEARMALASIHVHELKDYTLITVALLVKTDIAELLDFTNPPLKPEARREAGSWIDIDLRNPDEIAEERVAFLACLDRTINDCLRFMGAVSNVLQTPDRHRPFFYADPAN